MDKVKEFTKNQKARFSQFGVSPEQIREMEKQIPLAKLWLSAPTPKEDVTAELEALSKALDNAKRIISKILRADEERPAQLEAMNRLLFEDFELEQEGLALEKTLRSIAVTKAIATNALVNLTANSTPRRQTKWGPVQLIEEALLQGFINQHKTPFPPYMQTLSLSNQSQGIVGIFYEAIGESSSEASLRTYLRHRKQRETKRYGTVPQPKKSGHSRKNG